MRWEILQTAGVVWLQAGSKIGYASYGGDENNAIWVLENAYDLESIFYPLER